MLTEATLRCLETRMEELAVLFLDQSSPEEWRDLSDATKRGDTYWLKKNAAQTLSIMTRIQSLLNMHLRRGGGLGAEEGGVPAAVGEGEEQGAATAAMVQQAEADAINIIKRVAKSKK